jgi:dTDP-4-dehydrorhamnose 3,5-epimerase
MRFRHAGFPEDAGDVSFPEVIVVEPDVFRDARGFFLEHYNSRKYREAGIDAVFVQDNHSYSVRGTLRGLHAQRRRPQGKLVRVIAGEIFDVAVDIRSGSPLFGKWVGITLSAENFRQVYIPPGFAHGFCVLTESAEVEYKITDFYDPADEIGIIWNDPALAIRWPIEEPLLSARDRSLPRVAEIRRSLEGAPGRE